ncbi:MAG: CAP domain-containing protein [Candidatus Levyibacteriota bacterium]
MVRTVSFTVLFLCVFLLIFSFSAKVFAQEKPLTFSYLDYIKHAVIELTYITSPPKDVLGTTIQPTTQPTILPTATPASTPASQNSEVSQFLLTKVNEYRSRYSLPPVQSSAQVCAFAAVRAQEIANRFSHDGFKSRVSNHTIPYDNWAHATENIAEAPDYKEVVDLWAESSEHAANMRDNTPYVCIEASGPYYAYEGMRP